MSRANTLIFIDTCSLLDSCWDCRGYASEMQAKYCPAKEHSFWDIVLPNLSSAGEVIVTTRNYEELSKLSRVSDDKDRPALAERCIHVLKLLRPLIENGSVSIVGDKNDPFADAILLSAALKFRTQKNLLFITQDRALASDLVALANFASVRPRGFEMKVGRLARKGDIETWRFTEKRRDKNPKRSPFPQVPRSNELPQAPSEWWR